MLHVGDQVGGYRIEGVLGHGGMGVVYEARQLALNRKVALKLLAPQLGMDPSFKERFRQEGRIQAAIDHPNIVTVYEAGEIEEGLYFVMRLIQGSTLKELIIARELEGARTLRILTPIADALDAAHEAGLIHRDIKPQNILVGSRDHPYLADFGLTKGVNDASLTKTGQFVGTIDYISPEQIRGEPATTCSDIYSLAAVLYECLTGVVPYPKPSDAAVMFAKLSEPPPLVTEERPELPPALDDVLRKGMAQEPSDRYDTAGELIDDAKRAFGKRVRAVITPPGPVERPEETGIREAEGRVPTRPTRVRAEAPDVADRAVAPAAP
jgi:serine/threonine protein kinase